jgi:hypothetical protein
MSNLIRSLIGFMAIIIFNTFGILFIITDRLYFKILGSIWYIISGMTIYYLIRFYHNSEYFENLNKAVENE